MSLLPYIQILGRGPSKSRNLTREEAQDAMRIILIGDAEKEAIGALLMLLRYRGENSQELAGFVDAMREGLVPWQSLDIDLDWSSYSAGRSRGLPWFLLSAKLLAQNGHRVLLHGWNSNQQSHASVRGMLASLGIAKVENCHEASRELEASKICYVGLENLAPKLLDLLKLREVLGLRSPINSSMRLLNPARASASVQGVFHPAFLRLQLGAGEMLGQEKLGVVKGGGGEFEVSPLKPIALNLLQHGEVRTANCPERISTSGRLSEVGVETGLMQQVWTGEVTHNVAEEIVIGTAAAALLTMNKAGDFETALEITKLYWSARKCGLAA